MPLIRIDALEGRSQEEVKELLDQITAISSQSIIVNTHGKASFPSVAIGEADFGERTGTTWT